jgi:hypothetical protein
MKRALPLVLMLLLLIAGGTAAALVVTNTDDVVRPANADHLALETPAPYRPAANQPLEVPELRPQAELPAPTPAASEAEDDITPSAKPPQPKPVAAPGTSNDPVEQSEADIAGLRQDLERIRAELEQEVINDPAARPVRFSGTVVDHMGVGVEGANISIDYTKPTGPEESRRRIRAQTRRSLGRSGTDGVFSVVFYMPEELGASYDVKLLAGKVGEMVAPHHALTISPEGEYAGIIFAFPASAGVSGRVVDTEYNPVAGARVLLAPGNNGSAGGRFAPHSSTTTDSDGQFKITGIEGGSYTVMATASGYSHVVNAPTIVLSEGAVTTMPVDVVLARSTAIKFKAVCEERTPTGAFFVTCTDARGMQMQVTGRCKDGNAIITKAPAGTVQITIRWPNYKIGGQDTSDVIFVSMVEGQHTDLGEIKLEWAPMKRTTSVTKDVNEGK